MPINILVKKMESKINSIDEKLESNLKNNANKLSIKNDFYELKKVVENLKEPTNFVKILNLIFEKYPNRYDEEDFDLGIGYIEISRNRIIHEDRWDEFVVTDHEGCHFSGDEYTFEELKKIIENDKLHKI